MNISLLQIGKTELNFLREGIDLYTKRLNHYQATNIITLPNIKVRKSLSVDQIREEESQKIMQHLPPAAFVILLDENGSSLSSVGLSKLIQSQLNRGIKEMIFIVGGAYGVSDAIRLRANYILSLSQMTFTHQMVRLFILEQIYRAMTILRNEPYHNN